MSSSRFKDLMRAVDKTKSGDVTLEEFVHLLLDESRGRGKSASCRGKTLSSGFVASGLFVEARSSIKMPERFKTYIPDGEDTSGSDLGNSSSSPKAGERDTNDCKDEQSQQEHPSECDLPPLAAATRAETRFWL
jgi:hypothetical protein